jgi:hypothetical protein
MTHHNNTNNATWSNTDTTDGTLGLILLAGFEDNLPPQPVWGARQAAKNARRNDKRAFRHAQKANLGRWSVGTLAVAAAVLPEGATSGFVCCWRRKTDGELVGTYVPNRFKACRVAFHAGMVGRPESYQLLEVGPALGQILDYQADVASEEPF